MDSIADEMEAILFNDLKLSRQTLFKVIKQSLKATKPYGKSGVHPDYTERRTAAKELLAYVGTILPNKVDMKHEGKITLEFVGFGLKNKNSV